MDSSDHITLAVFPFEDLSLKKDLNIFCQAFGEDLVTELSKFRHFQMLSCPNYISTTDAASLKLFDGSKPDYFIQGSFRYEKDPVRINIQLYNSHTLHLVWGNRLEGKLTDLGDIQESLLTEVVGVLQQQINYDLLSRMKKRAKVEFNAYEHWLYGMEEVKKGSVENDIKAREHFEKAIEIQPDYSLAYSGISLTYFNEWSCQLWERWNISKSGAYQWAQKAIELDDQNYVAALILGKIFLYEGACETAEYYLRRSFLLNQNDPDTLIQIAAYFVYLGLGNEAMKLYERTLKLNPLNTSEYLPIGSFIFFELGEYEKAASLLVHSQNVKWADHNAYCAAIFYHLQQFDKMHAYWSDFLKTYRRLISHGNDFTEREAIEWVFKINPHRHKTNLEEFLKFISNGSFEKDSGQKNIPQKEIVPENYFIKEPSGWKLSFEGFAVQLPEVKGFYDIQKLLAQQRHLFHCAELMGSILDGKGAKLFDSKARQQYEKRILELQIDIQEAEQHSNFLLLEKLQDEYDKLIGHLSQSLGIKGKSRETGNPVEKARSAVTWRIRSAIAKIERCHPMLGTHLSNAIKTGTFCSYQPDRKLKWINS